ncbi:MAG: SCO1664 family protein [Caldilineales bacterium]
MDEQAPLAASFDEVMALLNDGEMTVRGLLPGSSNYTFLADICDDRFEGMVVYKPRQGETPLWDFPHGTLFQREMAAFQVSQMLGWGLVPPTVTRVGPYGKGAVQFFVDADFSQHYFSFRDEPDLQGVLMRIAAFDIMINNADRKGGHTLRDHGGRVWAIDHGVCFHTQPKLRTVIWEFAGEPLPADICSDLSAFLASIAADEPQAVQLCDMLSVAEVRALVRRTERLLAAGQLPEPDPHRRCYPWPLV